ncbi:hypothetical protein [Micromonospora coerulea]|uniref:hypothetical protein n=1 Tax=Micromonospora coerulea TaxID=47856 RepID=UPI0019063D68|nr:hypothetical protein [Micromonospora veneta]
MNSSDGSASMTVALGWVVVPSRTVVLACGGFLDQWAGLGDPLSVRAMRAADTGGAHLQDWLAEAVAVPAGPGALAVTARTRPGTFEAIDTIATLDIDLNLPWSAVSAGREPVVLGDLPVDPSGMVIGDAVALDSWFGFLPMARTVDGLADLRIWGKGDEEAWTHFGAQPIPALHTNRLHGWLDLPVEVAHERAVAINRWAVARGHFAHGVRRPTQPSPSRMASRLAGSPRRRSDRGSRLPDPLCWLGTERTSAIQSRQVVWTGVPADSGARRGQGRTAVEHPARRHRGLTSSAIGATRRRWILTR